MPPNLSHSRRFHPSPLPATENRDESWLRSNGQILSHYLERIFNLLGTNMREALRGNLVSAGSWLVNCSCGSFTAGAAQQRESQRRKAAATAAEICLNRGRGLGWGLSGWCLFWRFLMLQGAMFYMPTNFAFQVRKRLKQGLIACHKPCKRYIEASESAEVALFNLLQCVLYSQCRYFELRFPEFGYKWAHIF